MKTPDGWQIKRLDEIASVERGKFSARPRNAPQYYGGLIPFVQTGDVTSANGLLIQYSQTLNARGLAVSRLFPRGTILVTIAANIGDVALTTFDVACPDSLVAVQPSGHSAEWLAYALQSKKHELERAATQNAQKNINLQVLRPLKIACPPLAEQRKIAEILGTWDEAIALTEQLIEAKRQRKKALMQQLLTGRRRFREFEGQKWTRVRLDEIAQIRLSGVDKTAQPYETPVRLCNYMDVYQNEYITDALTFMEATATQREMDRYALRHGDVVMTKDSETREDIAVTAVVDSPIPNLICGYHLAIVRPKHQADGCFLAKALATEPVHSHFVRHANGAIRYGLTLSAIRGALVSMPPLAEQKKIATVLRSCDEEIDLLSRKLVLLQDQKKGLMQRLLIGKVRAIV